MHPPRRSLHVTFAFLGLLGASCLLAGCGNSEKPETGKILYSSSEEMKKKDADIKEAMQGGAYGTAGKKSAAKLGTPVK